MNFDDLKDQLKERLASIWSAISESPAYNTLRERYESLSPGSQKGLILTALVSVILLLLSVPASYLMTSSDNMTAFEENRLAIRDLLRASRLMQNSSQLPDGLSSADLRGRIQSALQGFDLLADQTVAVNELALDGQGPAGLQQSGVSVVMKQLNLVQILDIGQRLQNLTPAVRMADIEVTSNPVRSGYFDVTYKIMSYIIAADTEPVQEEKPRNRPRRPPPRNAAPSGGDE